MSFQLSAFWFTLAGGFRRCCLSWLSIYGLLSLLARRSRTRPGQGVSMLQVLYAGWTACQAHQTYRVIARRAFFPTTLAPAASAGEQSPGRQGDCSPVPARTVQGRQAVQAMTHKRNEAFKIQGADQGCQKFISEPILRKNHFIVEGTHLAKLAICAHRAL